MGKQAEEGFRLEGPWSHHRATSCPMALKLRQKKVPPDERARDGVSRRDLGSARHEGARLLMKGYLWKKQWPNLDKVMAVVNRRWPSVADAIPQTQQSLKAFTENLQFSAENVIGNEMKIAIDGNGNECGYEKKSKENPGGCPLDGWRGKIDLAEVSDGHAVITDYKNQMNILPKSQLRQHEQVAGMYPTLLRRAYPSIKTFTVGIYYLEYDFHQLVEVTDEEVQANFDRLRRRRDRLLGLAEKEIFPEPGPGRCNFCDYLEACPIGKDYLDKGGPYKITTPEQALKAAQALEVNEQRVKALKEAVQVWVKQNGNIELEPGVVRGYQKTNTKDWNKQKLKVLADRHEKDILELVNVDSDKANRFIKKHKVKIEDVCLLGNGTRFTSFKTTEETKKAEGKKEKESAKLLAEDDDSDACGALRPPYKTWKCDLPKGHRGDHIQYYTTTDGRKEPKNRWTNKDDPGN